MHSCAHTHTHANTHTHTYTHARKYIHTNTHTHARKYTHTHTHAQVCRANPAEKGRYIKIILSLLQSSSTAVVYECAVTLVSLSHAPSAVRAAANCYCQLLASQSDNNVKVGVRVRACVCACVHG